MNHGQGSVFQDQHELRQFSGAGTSLVLLQSTQVQLLTDGYGLKYGPILQMKDKVRKSSL